uniref:Uncharacterized protein n=1 Tax=Melopsittacus undulatus TaxID=13146 RepID=A0A8C6JHF3_MELUD
MRMMHAKHNGCESMHIKMMPVLIAALAVTQIVLAQAKSCSKVTQAQLWIILARGKNYWCRSLFICQTFSVIPIYITFRATCLEQSFFYLIHRLVYKCFLLIYKLIYPFGILDYLAIMFGFQHDSDGSMDFAVSLFLVDCMYYGVMERDSAEICSDYMAYTICFYNISDIPTRNLSSDICAVCGQKIPVGINEEGIIENTYQLSCNHVFHESYIHGWCLVGKDHACPYCLKKVNSKRMLSNPYSLPSKQLLDWLCYLVAWQPIVISIIQDISYSLGLE